MANWKCPKCGKERPPHKGGVPVPIDGPAPECRECRVEMVADRGR